MLSISHGEFGVWFERAVRKARDVAIARHRRARRPTNFAWRDNAVATLAKNSLDRPLPKRHLETIYLVNWRTAPRRHPARGALRFKGQGLSLPGSVQFGIDMT